MLLLLQVIHNRYLIGIPLNPVMGVWEFDCPPHPWCVVAYLDGDRLGLGQIVDVVGGCIHCRACLEKETNAAGYKACYI